MLVRVSEEDHPELVVLETADPVGRVHEPRAPLP